MKILRFKPHRQALVADFRMTIPESRFEIAADQQMIECCSCPITADGLLTLSVNNNLTANPLTAVKPNAGLIKLVSSNNAPNCDPRDITPTADLRAWATHVQDPVNPDYVITETEFLQAPLNGSLTDGTTEEGFLPETCSFIWYLGTGQGVCSCTGIG